MKAVLFEIVYGEVTFQTLAVQLVDGVSKERGRIIAELGEGDVVLSLRATKLADDQLWTTEQDPQRWAIGTAGDPPSVIFAAGVRGIHSRLKHDFSSIKDGDVINATDYAAGKA